MFGKIFKDNAMLWQTADLWVSRLDSRSALYYWADKDTGNADTGEKLFRSIRGELFHTFESVW